ncbi:MAG: hypothetical protein U0804_17340 [Gemmataceae bacterium]
MRRLTPKKINDWIITTFVGIPILVVAFYLLTGGSIDSVCTICLLTPLVFIMMQISAATTWKRGRRGRGGK